MTSKKYKMYYDYSKRTKGGFLDVIFLSGLMIVGFVFIMLSIVGGIK